MSTDITLSKRQRLVDTLCGDLNAQGWDQKNKLWFVKGDVEDEWLEFVGEFDGAPENHIVDLIAAKTSHPEVTGVVVSTEGWAYPKALADTFKTEAQLRSYWRLVPPSEHKERVEIRHVLLVSVDGEVIGLTARHDFDETKEWASLTADQKCPTGDRTVDAARALLGLNDELVERVRASFGSASDDDSPLSTLTQLKKVLDTMKDVMDGKMTSREASVALFHAMPEEARIQMIRDMPEQIKDTFREALSEEERKKYGL